MKIFLVILSTGSLFLFSCQKERDFANRNNGGNGGNSAGGLLVIMVQKTGSDSIVTTYGYDANKKIINLKKEFRECDGLNRVRRRAGLC